MGKNIDAYASGHGLKNKDAAIADASAPAALTQAAVTDALNGATFTGTALTTSATPTVDELETAFGVVGLQLNAARTDVIALRAEVATLTTKLNLALAALRTHAVLTS